MSQILAKFNRTYVPVKDDDSHTNLGFDPLGHRLYARWANTGAGRIIPAFNMEAFQFEFLDENRTVIGEFPADGKTAGQLEESIEQFLTKSGLEREGFRDKLHFEIPEYTFADSALEKPSDAEREKWENIRSIGNEACSLLLGYLQEDSDIRIWPHHFDTGVYVEPNQKKGLGFGLAMKDSMVGDAYFYYSMYRLDGADSDYSGVPSLDTGRWIITEKWKGAVLPVSDFERGGLLVVKGFIKKVSDGYLQ
ncbi:MAG: hypothetical protein ACNA8K_10335 [Cyclonatronaceae bacterium]